MNSGIEIPPEVIAEYKQCAMKGKHRYIIYKPNDDGTSILIDKIGPIDETFEDFKNSIQPNESL